MERTTKPKAAHRSALLQDFREYLEHRELGYWTRDNYFYVAQHYVHYRAERPRMRLNNPDLVASFLGRYTGKPTQRAMKSTALRASSISYGKGAL